MTWLTDLGLFALLFFLLVFIHELGHFLMARWMGVRVEKFSIGMGPQLVSKKIGDTLYRIALLPLGGYVKMAGDDPTKEYSEEEKKVGFLTQPPRKKLVIVLGGPAFNLILPLFVFSIMLAWGIPTVQTQIGQVQENSAAMEAGLQAGDQIVAVDGVSIEAWRDFDEIVKASAGQTLNLDVRRLNPASGEYEVFALALQPEEGEAMNRFGQMVPGGKAGIESVGLAAQIFYESENSDLAQAGFEKFEVVRSINGVEIFGLDMMKSYINARNPGDTLVFELENAEGAKTRRVVEVPAGPESNLKKIGFVSPELVVDTRFTSEESPATGAGLETGDRILKISGKDISAWSQVSEEIRATEGEPFELVWSRGGEEMRAILQAEKSTIPNPLLGKDDPRSVIEEYRIGVGPRAVMEQKQFLKQSWNPVDWVSYAASQTWELTSLTGQAFAKLVTGELSLKMLGSPIMIYKVAGNTYRSAGGGHEGWIRFLMNLALLSITLGLLNLLPIPVLDGGHVVFFSLEAIRGKPVSLRTMEIATQVGLFILFGIFAVVLYNDFYRYGFLDRVMQFFQ